MATQTLAKRRELARHCPERDDVGAKGFVP